MHIHLLEDNDRIKKNKDGSCQLGFSVSLIFHNNNKKVSAKIITGLSLSILSAEKVLRYRMAGITESAMVAYTHKYAVV